MTRFPDTVSALIAAARDAACEADDQLHRCPNIAHCPAARSVERVEALLHDATLPTVDSDPLSLNRAAHEMTAAFAELSRLTSWATDWTGEAGSAVSPGEFDAIVNAMRAALYRANDFQAHALANAVPAEAAVVMEG